MNKKQLGIFIQVFGVVLLIVLPKEIGAWKLVIAVILIFIGGLVYRTAKKEEKK